MKILREKEGGKTNIVCVYIYMASLRGRGGQGKKTVCFFFSGLSPLIALLCTQPLPDGRLAKVAKECPESHEDPLGKGRRENKHSVCIP